MGLSERSHVLVVGGTGLIGARVLEAAGRGEATGHWHALARRVPEPAPPGIHWLQASLQDPQQDRRLREDLKSAAGNAHYASLVCCLGTTLRKAGSQAAFLAVDRDLVLRMVQIGRELGVRQAILVSSVGASRQSSNFYLRVKGEVEAALALSGIGRIDILRPGLLLGERTESRPGEALMRRLTPLYNPLLPGPLRRYRSIAAVEVAATILALTGRKERGFFIHEYDQIRKLASARRD